MDENVFNKESESIEIYIEWLNQGRINDIFRNAPKELEILLDKQDYPKIWEIITKLYGKRLSGGQIQLSVIEEIIGQWLKIKKTDLPLDEQQTQMFVEKSYNIIRTHWGKIVAVVESESDFFRLIDEQKQGLQQGEKYQIPKLSHVFLLPFYLMHKASKQIVVITENVMNHFSTSSKEHRTENALFKQGENQMKILIIILGIIIIVELVRRMGHDDSQQDKPTPQKPNKQQFSPVDSDSGDIPIPQPMPTPVTQPKPETFILTVVVSEGENELLDKLRQEGKLTPETATQLFHVKSWVLYLSEQQWYEKCQSLFQKPSPYEPNEYDIYFIKMKLNEGDERLSQNSNLIKMSDAFKELGQKGVFIEVSPRHPKESYENKGFYRV